jgi:hypothetical protein
MDSAASLMLPIEVAIPFSTRVSANALDLCPDPGEKSTTSRNHKFADFLDAARLLLHSG